MNKEKMRNIGVGLLILLVIVGLFYWRNNKKGGIDKVVNDVVETPVSLPNSDVAAVVESVPVVKAPAATKKTTTIKPPVGSAPLSYIQARDAYQKTGYYQQFVQCDMVAPLVSVVKKGHKVMLDNRDNVKRVISYAGKTYTVSALGYVLATTDTVGEFPTVCAGRRVTSVKIVP